MKKPLLILCLSLSTSIVFAQTYKDKAAEVQKMVADADNGPEFKLTAVPAQYNNESAVILAQSFRQSKTTSTKLHYMLITVGVAKKFITTTTFHERVKINDKAALENYSTLSYQKKLDKSINLLFSKVVDTHDTYLGVRITKPNGKEITVDAGEEVLTKNTNKDQKGKLAISDLQVGDILDYYISTSDISENGGNEGYSDNAQVFMQVGEYPILYYSVDLQIGKKLDVQALCANGAKQMTELPATKDDRFFTLRLKDLPKYQGQLWTSVYRQYPYVQFGASFSTDYVNLGRRRDQSTSRIAGIQADFAKMFNEQYFAGYTEPEKKLKDIFDGKKGIKNAPLDSTMKVLYDIWKYDTFCNYAGTKADDITELNYRTANSKIAAIRMGLLLTDMKINYDVILVSARNNSSLVNAFMPSDVNMMIRINDGAKPMYMAFNDAFTQFNEIPAQYQGENAFAMHMERKNAVTYNFTTGNTTLPVVSSDKNRIEQNITITLPTTNMQKLQVDRTVKQTGYLRHDGQRMLVSAADVDRVFTAHAKGDDLTKRLKNNSDTKKLIDAFTSGMTKGNTEIKKDFSDEIKGEFDQEPQQLTNFKVLNPGLEGEYPVFEYSSSFMLDNMVKKAGNNYIIDAGKLAGTFLKLEEKDRKRNADIYMPGTRSFKYNITINIPKGYKIKGMEELTRGKNNRTGVFSSTATVNGNTLTISINRAYNTIFEKAADWPLVTELIDAASDFNNQKILLEKEG